MLRSLRRYSGVIKHHASRADQLVFTMISDITLTLDARCYCESLPFGLGMKRRRGWNGLTLDSAGPDGVTILEKEKEGESPSFIY